MTECYQWLPTCITPRESTVCHHADLQSQAQCHPLYAIQKRETKRWKEKKTEQRKKKKKKKEKRKKWKRKEKAGEVLYAGVEALTTSGSDFEICYRRGKINELESRERETDPLSGSALFTDIKNDNIHQRAVRAPSGPCREQSCDCLAFHEPTRGC